MENYTLERHIDNINFLKGIYSKSTKLGTEDEMFNEVNKLADFVQGNKQYLHINSFNALLDEIVEIIDFCNSNKYTFSNFIKKFNKLYYEIKKLSKDILQTYNINTYFVGKDKYGLLNKIIKNNNNFKIISEEIRSDSIKKNFEFNILILSEETFTYKVNDKNFDKIIYYDQLMNSIFNLVEKLYYNNYDYNYLVNAIKKAKKDIVTEVFVGHSHSLHGINESEIKESMVNLSLQSQNIYYSAKIAKEVIESNKNIKSCFIGTAYWSLYSDLSRTEYGKEIIRNVYYPILKDSCNYQYEANGNVSELIKFNDIIISEVFNIEEIYNFLSKIIFDTNKSYFNSLLKRENCGLIGGKILSNLSEEEKFELAQNRTDSHNKLIKYKETREENEKLLNDFLLYLNKKNIKAYIINFPTTRYYNKFLNKKFKDEYYNIINKLKEERDFKFLDLNDYNFNDEDFVDMDHVSDIGASKITNILNEFIYS